MPSRNGGLGQPPPSVQSLAPSFLLSSHASAGRSGLHQSLAANPLRSPHPLALESSGLPACLFSEGRPPLTSNSGSHTHLTKSREPAIRVAPQSDSATQGARGGMPHARYVQSVNVGIEQGSISDGFRESGATEAGSGHAISFGRCVGSSSGPLARSVIGPPIRNTAGTRSGASRACERVASKPRQERVKDKRREGYEDAGLGGSMPDTAGVLSSRSPSGRCARKDPVCFHCPRFRAVCYFSRLP